MDVLLFSRSYSFLCDVARARGARREFADDQQWTALSEGTLVLCYHKFSAPRGERSRQVIPADQFERQMEALKSAGYRFVTLRVLLDARRRNEIIGGRTAIVTIDEGTDDVIERAAPVLRRAGIADVFYLTPNWIGKPGLLNAVQIKSLAAEGWEVGAHSLSHTRLPTMEEARQREEIATSRSALSEVAVRAPETFAYPYGDCDATSQRLAKEAGYEAALGVDKGFVYVHTSAFNLPRFVVDGRWPLWLFKLIVIGGITMGGPL